MPKFDPASPAFNPDDFLPPVKVPTVQQRGDPALEAQLMAQELGITLTKRGDVPMAGIPVIGAEQHWKQLNGSGINIAIADTLREITQKKPVKSGFTEIIKAPSGDSVAKNTVEGGSEEYHNAVWQPTTAEPNEEKAKPESPTLKEIVAIRNRGQAALKKATGLSVLS